MSSLYVYAVTGSPIETFTDGEYTLESVEIDGLHVVADRSGVSVPASEESLRRQHKIVERIAERAGAVLPARFGTAVDIEEARRVLGSRRRAIEEALALVTARRQMTVRFRARRGEPQPDAAPVAATGTAYLRSRRAAAAGTLPEGDLARFRVAVRDLVAAERIVAGRETVMSTVYHLVERSRTAEYRQRAVAAGEDLAAATVTVTGPWPAFAFAPELL